VTAFTACLYSTTALADPISIGSFVISAFLSAGVGAALPVISAAAIGNFVIGAAVIGASVLSSALTKAPSIKPEQYKNTFEDAGSNTEIRAVGRVRVGGLKAFGNTIGVKRYRLICHVKGEWTVTEEHYLGGREVVVDDDTGAVSSPPWSKTSGSYVYINAKSGDGTETAWSDLVTDFPDLWTSDHRVRGIAQSLVRYDSPGIDSSRFLKLYQQGEPNYERVGRAEAVYDPRTATTAWDDNGILCAAHILTSYPSFSTSNIDWADIGAEAQRAEVSVATKTGTEERARIWGFWQSEAPRGDVMEQVLRSIGAEIVPTTGSLYTIRLVDDVRVPEIVFSEKHIVALDWRSGPESVERPNVCRVKYYSPERNYEMADIDLTGIAWARVEDEITRVGEQYFDVELPYCPSASQAQRIARRLFALARADAGVVTTNMAGLAAWGLTVAEIPLPELDRREVCAIGTPRVNDSDGTVEIPFVVWPTLTPWDTTTDEAAAPEAIPDLQFPSVLDVPDTPSAYALVQYSTLAYEVRIRTSAVSGADTAEGNWRPYRSGLPESWQGMTEPNLTFAWDGAVSGDIGNPADFRIRYYDGEELSYFSALLSTSDLQIDNSTPGAPDQSTSGTGSSRTITYSTTEIQVVKLTFERRKNGGSWSLVSTRSDIRPDTEFNDSVSQDNAFDNETWDWRIAAYTSNDTASVYATGSVFFAADTP
jgi:hypothetical protein